MICLELYSPGDVLPGNNRPNKYFRARPRAPSKEKTLPDTLPTTDTSLLRPLASGYTREAKVLAQLAPLQAAGPATLTRRVRDTGEPLSEESLVCILRCLMRQGDARGAGDVFAVLACRTADWTRRNLAVWGFEGLLAEQLQTEIYEMLLTDVFDGGPRAAFWECRFWVCFNRRALSVLETYARRRAQEVSLTVPEDDGDWDGLDAYVSGQAVSLDTQAQVRIALQSLPPLLRDAFYLKHCAGYAEESHDPHEPTIARALGKSGRMVRYYLKEAAARLAAWRDDDTA